MITKKSIIALACAAVAIGASAQEKVTITLKPDTANQVIPKEIYGQFAEHLGSCIYGGLWVGEDSPIPNTNGYRNDVLQALKDLKVPVLRWPGGCFADEYHWMDGIGPKETRPRMVNTNWGGTVEDNSFGTHEFFNLCELIGAEPYLSGNVGSGTVEELAKWVEYITAEEGPMASLRRTNGRSEPWKLKYLGVGNESWGCGGNFIAEDYAGAYRRYNTYCRNYGDNVLYRIASGASDYDYDWTETLMKKAGNQMDGLSLHYYTCKGWSGSKGSATDFTETEYDWALGKCLEIEPVIRRHMGIMDRYDRRKRVGLLVDEWGTWWDVETGTNPGHLFQQNTMRDAMVAALSLNVFHMLTDRVKMANIAQIANVLQAMVLTKDDQMVLTPTYYVFKMYQPHQDATYIPLTSTSAYRQGPDADRLIPEISATASQKDGRITISVANTSLTNDSQVEVVVPDGVKMKGVSGEILTAADIHDYNDFGRPEKVTPKAYTGAKIAKGTLTLSIPAKSIVTVTLD